MSPWGSAGSRLWAEHSPGLSLLIVRVVESFLQMVCVLYQESPTLPLLSL